MTKPRTNPWMGGPCPDCEAHREEIKALEAQVRELEEQLSEAIGVGQLSADAATERGAENKRLREALAEARYAAVAIPLEALSAAGYAGGLSEDLQDAIMGAVLTIRATLREKP